MNLNANGDSKNDYSTAFPVAIARGAAFDVDLEYHIGQAIGDEMLASGNTMLLAPTVNILRHPAWGRAQETYGEDRVPARPPRQRVRRPACSSTSPPAPSTTPPTTSRTAARAANAMMDEQTLREIYARHFEMMIQDGGVVRRSWPSTTSGQTARQRSTQNTHLLTDILRTDFGFQGFVLVRLVGDAERQQRSRTRRRARCSRPRSRRSTPASIWSCPGDTTTRR